MSYLIQSVPDKPEDLEAWINEQENAALKIKDGARASIVWADSDSKNKTPYSIVYLHGFKASHPEGDPIHKEVAKHFGFNLYLSRLDGHGLDIENPLSDVDPLSFEQSAYKALEIGKKIGEKVIIMGTSTGGSLGLLLASQPNTTKHIAALILYSPLIKFYGISQWFLSNPFSRAILRIIPGKKYAVTSKPGSSAAEKKIWYDSYALQGALALGEFIEKEMTNETFSRNKCPVFIGYYYKNTNEQDTVVSVSAIREMAEKIGTEESQKILKNFPNARTHVISSGLLSKCIPEVRKETIQFLETICGSYQL